MKTYESVTIIMAAFFFLVCYQMKEINPFLRLNLILYDSISFDTFSQDV